MGAAPYLCRTTCKMIKYDDTQRSSGHGAPAAAPGHLLGHRRRRLITFLSLQSRVAACFLLMV